MGSFISGERPWRRSRIVETVTDPAAGAEWSATVPAGKLWRVRSIYATLTTAVAAANRQPNLVVGDGVAQFLLVPPVAVQAASKAGRLAWVEHGSAYATGDDQALAIPELVLEPGWTIGTDTDNIQAADQWSGITLLVVETTIKAGAVELADVPDMVVEVITGTAG